MLESPVNPGRPIKKVSRIVVNEWRKAVRLRINYFDGQGITSAQYCKRTPLMLGTDSGRGTIEHCSGGSNLRQKFLISARAVCAELTSYWSGIQYVTGRDCELGWSSINSNIGALIATGPAKHFSVRMRINTGPEWLDSPYILPECIDGDPTVPTPELSRRGVYSPRFRV